MNHRLLAATLFAAILTLGACSKTPEPAAPAAPAAPSAPQANAAPAAAASAAAASAAAPAANAAPVGNPEASKDPVFNMPPKPVLDVAASKAQYDKIYADFMK